MSEANKQNGYNRNLYRDPDAGWIAGVCAGLAESYGQPVWLARIIMLSVFIFSGSLGVLLYIAGVVLLAKRPRNSHTPSHGRPLFDYGESASDRARQLKERMRALEMRLQSMERYVTSNRFNVNKELKNL